MSKSSARRRNKPAQHHSSAPYQSSTQRKAQTPARPAPKVRGGWLTAMLVIIVIHGIFSAILLFSYRKESFQTMPPWLMALAVAIALADIIAAVALWYWKRWGLYLYTAACLGSIVTGLVVFPSLYAAFHALVPLLILTYILQAQRKMPLLT